MNKNDMNRNFSKDTIQTANNLMPRVLRILATRKMQLEPIVMYLPTPVRTASIQK